MKDSVHYQKSSSIVSDLKAVSSVINSRKTKVFLYGFVFTFVACTTYLAFFNPSGGAGYGTGAPWFNNLFSSAATSTAPYRSQISNFFSRLLPNSTSTSLSLPEGGIQAGKNGAPAPAGRNGVTREGIRFQPGGGDARNKSVEELGFEPKNGQSLETRKEGDAGSQESEVSGKNTARTKSLTGNANSTKIDSSLKKSESSTSAGTPPISTSVPAKEDRTSKKQSDTGNHAASDKSPPAITKSQSNSTSQSSSAPLPSGAKNASPDRKDQNQSSGSQAAINSKGSEATTSSQNYTASLAKGNEGAKGVPKNAPNTDVSKKNDMIKSMIGCDMFEGEWVRDDSYPLYPEGSCPHIDEPFDCYHNGRPDRTYQKLRWQPRGCTIPRFNAIDMLERLRGKRLVFIGDSLNRNMWESLVCALRHSVKDKLKVFEASGRHEFRTEGSYSFLFTNYNCSVEFFRSPFLVQEWEMPTGNSTKKETLRIDLIERSSPKYKDADVLVFNTGHWWTHEKTSQGKDYYQEGNHVYSELNVLDAFHKALSTWAKWIDTNVNPKKTLVLFRGYSASHFSGGQWNSGGACDKETEPIKDDKYLAMYPTIMNTLEDVINSMKTPVVYLNITRMSDYRKDAHPSIYRKQNLTEEERRSPERYQDCSHWCLPGVPDSWNELLYAQLLVKQYLMTGK